MHRMRCSTALLCGYAELVTCAACKSAGFAPPSKVRTDEPAMAVSAMQHTSPELLSEESCLDFCIQRWSCCCKIAAGLGFYHDIVRTPCE